MKFSVLMSVYYKERADYLEQAINSIIKQTLLPNEIVIVKDGKLTKELDMVINRFTLEYPDLIKCIVLKNNLGLGNALKIGVENCKYPIIARMDSDDISHPQRFEVQMKYLRANSNITIVGTNACDFIEDINNIVSYRVFPKAYRDVLNFSKRRCPFLHPTIMFRKEDIISIGSYKDLLFFEDYYLFLRILKNGYKGVNIQQDLLYFRVSPDTYSRRGGLSYIKYEFKAYCTFYRDRLLNLFDCFMSLVPRSIVRLIPNGMRTYIYHKFLRENKK